MVNRRLLWIIPALLVAIIIFKMLPGDRDEEQIRKAMKELCTKANMEETESPLAAVGASKELASYFREDMQFQQSVIPYTVNSRLEFEAMVFKGRTTLDIIKVSIRDMEITVNPNHVDATMKVSMDVQLESRGHSQRDWRALALDWTKTEGEWLIARVTMVETIRRPI